MEKQVANSTDNKNINTENTNLNQYNSEHGAGEEFNTGIDEKFEKDKNKPVLADVDADKEMENEDTANNKSNPQKSGNDKPSHIVKEIKKTEKAPPY